MSYNSAFLILCLITCILRAIFFMFFGFWMEKPRHLLGLIMFWYDLRLAFHIQWRILMLTQLFHLDSSRFPTNLQFATFSLLAVFYASITNASRWRSVRVRCVCFLVFVCALRPLSQFLTSLPSFLADQLLSLLDSCLDHLWPTEFALRGGLCSLCPTFQVRRCSGSR